MNSGDEIERARHLAGLTQASLAERAGTSQATVSAYESGTKVPSLATFERLLAAAGARLTVEGGHEPVRLPSRSEQARIGRELVEVIALAAELPTEHHPDLVYPRLSRR